MRSTRNGPGLQSGPTEGATTGRARGRPRPAAVGSSAGQPKAAVRQVSDYELWAQLDASGFAIYRVRELELARFHLTVEQASVLRVLQSANHPLTAKSIRDMTLRQQNTISILVARMAAAGLVTNDNRPGRRESEITITPEGRRLLEGVPAEGLERVFSVLGGAEKKRLARYMRSLNDKARSLLVPEGSAFMQYIAPRKEMARSGPSEIQSAPSAYVLWSLVDSARFAISRLRVLELAQYGLTVEQASMLRVLAGARQAGRSLTTGRLEDITLRQHHSVSTLIERMTRAGLTERDKLPGERRYRVKVTQKGKDLLEGLTAVGLEMTFSALQESDKEDFRVRLVSLHRKAREMLGVWLP